MTSFSKNDIFRHSAPHNPSHNPYEAIGIAHMVIGIGKDEYVVEEALKTEVGGQQVSIDPLFAVYAAMYMSEAYGTNAVWIRPLANMFDDIGSEGIAVPRFQVVTAKSK